MATEEVTDENVITTKAVDQQPRIVTVGDESAETPVEETPTIETAPVETTADAETDATDTTPSYDPDFKYKVYDEIKEMPEWAKGLITNKELEDSHRELFQKADALETVKERYDNVREERDEVMGKLTAVTDKLGEIQHYIDNDLHTAFEVIGISKERIIDYVQSLIKEQDMTPQERQQHEQYRRSIVDTYQARQQAEMSQVQAQQLARNAHELEYQRVLSTPEIAQFQAKFDQKLGPGSFKKHADQYGLAYYQSNGGVETTPLDAVNHVMGTYKAFIEGDTVAQEQTGNGPAVPEKPKGHLPNVGSGRGAQSPTKPRFTSIDALRKYADTMQS